MQDGLSFEVIGLRELTAKLDKLSLEVRRKISRRALRAFTKPALAAERALCPVNTDGTPGGNSLKPGELRADLRARVRVDGNNDRVIAIVGPSRKTMHVARWVERGHNQVSGGRKVVSKKSGGSPGKVIGHVPAHPFIRPAFDESLQQCMANLKVALEKGVKRKWSS